MSSKWVEEKVRYHVCKHLKPDSALIRPFTKLLTEIFQNEFQFLKKSKKHFGANVPKQKSQKRNSRKLSDYVQFCRYMKKNFPEKKNLQTIWKNQNVRNQWKMVDPQHLIIQAETQMISLPNNKFRSSFYNVLLEFKMLAEIDDPQETLMNIRREACFNNKFKNSISLNDEEVDFLSESESSCFDASESNNEVQSHLSQ